MKRYKLILKKDTPFVPDYAEANSDDLECYDCEYMETLEWGGAYNNYPIKLRCRILNVEFEGHIGQFGESEISYNGEHIMTGDRIKICPFEFVPMTLQEQMEYYSRWLEEYRNEPSLKDEWDKIATLFDDSIHLITSCSDMPELDWDKIEKAGEEKELKSIPEEETE